MSLEKHELRPVLGGATRMCRLAWIEEKNA